MYLRKSQFDKDFSELSVEETLQRHKTRLDEFCLRHNIYPDLVLEEVVSGESLSARPKMQRLLELVSTGEYDGVICTDIDRLSRGSGFDSGYIMQVLQTNRCKIYTPDKVYDLSDEQDEQFTDMKFMFSRFELRTIRNRLENGRQQSINEGKYTGSIPPLGYERVKLVGQKGYTLKVLPVEAELIKLIYNLYVNHGMGYMKLVEYLNENGFAQYELSVSGIRNILSNVTYTGHVKFGQNKTVKRFVDGKMVVSQHKQKEFKVVKGLHEPIISSELWLKAKAIRENKKQTTANRKSAVRTPFANLIRCGGCSGAIKNAKRPHSDARFYKCDNKDCDCMSTSADNVDGAILHRMREYLADYKIKIKTPDTETVNYELMIETTKKQIDQLKKQRDDLCNYLETGIYTVELFKERNDKLSAQISDLEKSLENLKEALQEHSDSEAILVPQVESLLDSYDILSGSEKNQVWKEVLDKVTYYKRRGTDEIEIEIYPKF